MRRNWVCRTKEHFVFSISGTEQMPPVNIYSLMRHWKDSRAHLASEHRKKHLTFVFYNILNSNCRKPSRWVHDKTLVLEWRESPQNGTSYHRDVWTMPAFPWRSPGLFHLHRQLPAVIVPFHLPEKLFVLYWKLPVVITIILVLLNVPLDQLSAVGINYLTEFRQVTR